ncbi:MAG: Ribonuclease [Phycisphaerae bacterium]|nr:Ribonuclease [Phycisphaerae bacterium]
MELFSFLFGKDGKEVELLFHGAARQVTGSMHYLRVGERWIALDCGLYQGHRREAEEANRRFPIPPKELTAVVLSHAHIDHSGNLPYLVKQGFSGPIYCTPATRDLSAVMLQDAAHIQEEDAAYWNKKHPGDPIEPYYTQEDALAALSYFVTVPYDRTFPVVPRTSCQFHDAGHILGSASLSLTVDRNNGLSPLRIGFTGDLGRRGLPILRDPAPLPECDYLISESTYGNRRHDNPNDMKTKLAEVVTRTVARGGRVVIPAFSVGRTQTLVYYLRQIFEEKLAPQVDVFVDSPLAVSATEVFKMHPEIFDREAQSLRQSYGGSLFECAHCNYITDVSSSKALNDRKEPCVVISASGMCEAGRILHHLKNAAPDPRNTIVIVGFMAVHTLGRRIVDREPELRIFGKMYPLEAEVKTLNGFSSHADAGELDEYLFPLAKSVKHLFLVHGETGQYEPLAARCREAGFAQVTYPERGDRFSLE